MQKNCPIIQFSHGCIFINFVFWFWSFKLILSNLKFDHLIWFCCLILSNLEISGHQVVTKWSPRVTKWSSRSKNILYILASMLKIYMYWHKCSCHRRDIQNVKQDLQFNLIFCLILSNLERARPLCRNAFKSVCPLLLLLYSSTQAP